MLVMTSAPEGASALPRVAVVLDPAEIEGLLAGATQRFIVTIDGRPLEVELLASSTSPVTTKPAVRLRVADDAIRAARIGTVTPLFPVAIPFTLSLACSAPATDAGPVRIAPGITYERIDMRGPAAPRSVQPAPPSPAAPLDGRMPLRERILIGLGVAGFFGVLGAFQGREAPLYWLVGIGGGIWAVVGQDRRGR